MKFDEIIQDENNNYGNVLTSEEIENLQALMRTIIDQNGATRISLYQELKDIKKASLEAQEQIVKHAKMELIKIQQNVTEDIQNTNKISSKIIKQLNLERDDLRAIKDDISRETNQQVKIFNDNMVNVKSKVDNVLKNTNQGIDEIKGKLTKTVNYEYGFAVFRAELMTGLVAGFTSGIVVFVLMKFLG